MALVSGCGGSPASAPALGLTSCTVHNVPARCGQFQVAENPAAPAGRKISLRVVVLPAHTEKHAPDPLFYFAGGPGGAATDSAAWAYTNLFVLNDQHDIVLIDQRGTGGSNQVTCNLDYSSPTDEAIAAGINSCLTTTGGQADPQYYTTLISVDDYDQVRAALGYDKIDIYGISYGVSSGLSYMQRHGDHVRSALFDSGSLLDVRLWELVPVSAQHALDELFTRCASDNACARAFPDVKAEFAGIVRRLSAGPMNVGYVDSSSGTRQTATVELAGFLNFLIDGYLANMRSAAALPRAIHTAAHGDWNDFVHAYQAMAGASPDLVMTWSIICSDAWARYDTDTMAAIGTGSVFTPAAMLRAKLFNAQCKYWPHAVGAGGTVQSSVPVVFLNGTADPADPPANVAGAIATMPNSLSVTFPGFGHGVLDQDTTGCLSGKASAFLDAGRPSRQADWTNCLLLTPDFVTQ